MALLGFEGWDHYNSPQGDMLNKSGCFVQFTSGSFSSFQAGRNGYGKSIGIGSSLTAVYGARNSEAFLGWAFEMQITGTSDVTVNFLDTLTNTTQFALVFVQSNATIQVWRGTSTFGTLIYTSDNNVWDPGPGVWQFVEVHPIISHTGSVVVRINEVVKVNLTGANIQASTNTTFDSMSWTNGGFGLTNGTIDDFYYCDTTTGSGSYPCNDFLGDSRVATLFAIGNDSVQWTPNPGANANWQNINETAMNSDTTYNSTATATNEDRFNFNALPNAISVIYGIQVVGAYRKDDAGLREVKQAVQPAATTYYGSTWSLPDTSYAYFCDLWILNPDTSANWTDSDINAIAVGYNLVA